jgi:hypothetical protein
VKTIRRETRTIKQCRFTAAEVLAALGISKVDDIQSATKSRRTNIDIFVRVPGGGDWSNTNLDIESHPLIVEIEEITSEQEE